MNFGKLKFSLLIIAITIINCEIAAEDVKPARNVYVDFFSSSNIFSANFDTRFPNSSVLGWKAGVGYSQKRFPEDEGVYHFFGNYLSGISFPVGINALFGRNKYKFEIGLDAIPGIYSYQPTEIVINEDNIGGSYERKTIYGPKSWRGGCSMSIDLGYRFQQQKGFCFRVGLSPCVDFNSEFISLNLWSFFPYLSFGYSFL